MPKYTFARELRTFWYTTIEADSYSIAIDLADQNFENFENIEEGDAEWDLVAKFIDEQED